jgi:glutamate-1-semialdehyde 2,1-aminomutase
MQSGVQSRAAFRRASQVIPCGVNSNFRYWGDDKTLVVKRAEGAYLWDQDDVRYIDYRLGFGPVILGHAHPAVTARVREALEIGNAFAMTNMLEIEAAERLCRLSGLDLVRFANSGTEATMHAIRIARAYTGRNRVLKFEGHYHGFHDYTLWNCYPPIPGSGYRRAPVPVAHGSGIPQLISRLVVIVPFNDEELLEKRVAENWGDLACIIVEPVMGNTASIMPARGFLAKIRELCDRHGIVMIMDEVKTGFRIARGGAQEYFGVKADLAAYAKALANGFPLGAIAGRREIMAEIGPMMIPHGGTYAGNVVAAAAACATLEEIEGGALTRVDQHGRRLMKGIAKILASAGIPALVQGPPAMFGVVFSEKPEIRDYRDWAASDHALYEQVILGLMERGVMPDKDSREPWFVSAAHSNEDLDRVLDVFEQTVRAVLKA